MSVFSLSKADKEEVKKFLVVSEGSGGLVITVLG